MKALITGITGFAGSHLAEYLLSRGDVEVSGTYRLRSRMDHIRHLTQNIHLVECELKDAHSVNETIKQMKPDLIFHLAAQSFVPTSWNAPSDTLVNNIESQVNLFEAVRKFDIGARIQIACSSEEYGLVHPEETPIKESNPLRPLSPYAVSKVGQDCLGYQYFQSYGLKVVRTRTFNHTGPRRGEAFVTSNFAKQIVQVELGQSPARLFVGNLDAMRDFTDVRDVVKAYWLALEKGEAGEVYNIASGRAVTIRHMLQTLLSLSRVTIDVEVDPARLRPSDVEILLGDSTKFRDTTGWKPDIPFEQTMSDLLNYWRSVLQD